MFNAVRRVQGWSDTPLTAEGVDVALKLGRGLEKEKIKFISVWSGDSCRAGETVRLIMQSWNAALPLNESRELREVCFGLYEGDLDTNMWEAAVRRAGYGSEAALMQAYEEGAIRIEQIIAAIKESESQGTTALKDIKSRGGSRELSASGRAYDKPYYISCP